MSDDTPSDKNVSELPSANLLAQVTNELAKGKNDAAKAKLKEKLKAKAEHEKSIALINIEIEQILKDHAAGIL